jgi:NADH-quinone oxidoreductase subunit K
VIHLAVPLVAAALLFGLGVYGVLARRNAVLLLMSVELMLNAVNLNLVAFGPYLQDRFRTGEVTSLFVVTIAAAEVGVGLAIVLLLFRRRESVDLDRASELREDAA